ncbi:MULTISPECIES: hypothetical protein [unclassified Nostoc]|nr:hypothetical protein [Nostoc sp. ChiQUE01b]MDZ8263394.1 hypothetical protein [Nostoc sp. ChiQUE01b]
MNKNNLELRTQHSELIMGLFSRTSLSLQDEVKDLADAIAPTKDSNSSDS